MPKENELQLLSELNHHYDLDELERQLESVIASKDPIGYMKSNINWEIDKDLDDFQELSPSTLMMAQHFVSTSSYEAWNPIRKFLDWLNRSKLGKKIKKTLCQIKDKIKELIDEEAKLKEILGVAIVAVAAVIGLGAINPAVLTLIVGFLATMILKGVEEFCQV